MNAKIAFCEECRKDVSFVETSISMTGTIKDKEYRYIGRQAYCADCCSELFVPELTDLNLRELYDVFPEKTI